MPAFSKTLQNGRAAWTAAVSRLTGAVPVSKSRRKGPTAPPEIQSQIVDAISVYLGGNHDLASLRVLAEAHPDDVRETILRYQGLIEGRRDELGELTLKLGYVQRWCQEVRSANVARRRQAFSFLAAVAHHGQVRRILGAIPANAFADSDEQVRVHAARILLSSGELPTVGRVFEVILEDTPCVRLLVAADLRRHAIPLCKAAIPKALESANLREVLRLLVSWECALHLPDVRPLVKHPDPEVRVDCMRLLPFLPSTPENRAALLAGLADPHPDVSAAAAATGRVMLPGPAAMASLSPNSLAMVG